MSLFNRKSIAGVEIDSYEIRVVELGGSPCSPSLISAGRIPLPEGAVRDGRIVKPEAAGEILGKLWAEAGIKTKGVILGVSNQDVLLRFAFFPKVPPDRLDGMIRFQAQEYIPLSISDVELDYMVLGEVTGERGPMLHVLLVAARKAMISDFIGTIAAAGLNIEDIDASNLAMMRLLPPIARNRTSAMVCLTNEQAGMIILRNGIPALSRIVMVNSAGMNVRGISIGGGYESRETFAAEDEAAGLSDSLIGEIRSSIGYFQNQAQNAAIDKVYLCGCAGGKRGLAAELREGLGLPIEMLDSLAGISQSSARRKITGSGAADYSICISLALRGLEGSNR